MMYLGDYTAGDTIYFMWSTNAGDGSSITRATNGTVSVYKTNNTTQTTTGVTDTEDFDSLTGIHQCRIVTTDAFYATGNDFAVVLSGATIDGKSVNAVLAIFSIGNRAATPVKVAEQVWFTPVEDHTLAGTMGQMQELAAADDVADIADAVWDELLSGHSTTGSAGEALAGAGGGATAAAIADAVWDEVVADHLDTDTAATHLKNAGQGDFVNGSNVAAVNERKYFDGTGYAANTSGVGTVNVLTGTVAANIVALDGDAAALDRLTALLGGVVVGVVGATGNTTTAVKTTGLTAAAANFYAGKMFIAITGGNAGQGGKLVTGWDGATKVLTIEALTAPMTPGDAFVLVG